MHYKTQTQLRNKNKQRLLYWKTQNTLGRNLKRSKKLYDAYRLEYSMLLRQLFQNLSIYCIQFP